MENIEVIKTNCREYAQTKKAVEVLRNANGQKDYKAIAENVDIHPTRVSSLLKKAEKLGLARKKKAGFYKKIPGILSYLPKTNINLSQKKSNIPSILKALNKPKKTKYLNAPVGLKVPSAIQNNLNKMSEAYRHLFAVENVLRSLIRKVLEKKPDWWKNNIPAGIQKSVADEMLRTVYHAASRKDELEYTHLGGLKEIIIMKKNWNDFLPFLHEKDKNSFYLTVNKAIPSRNAVGHCIALTTNDLKIVEVRFGDILKMII